MEIYPTRLDSSLPMRINSLRVMINRRDSQLERMRDEVVMELLEYRKGIKFLKREQEELQNHIDGIGLFLKDFFVETYFELFDQEETEEKTVSYFVKS